MIKLPKLSFKQVFYWLLLAGLFMVGLTQCTKNLVQPWATPNLTQEDLVYQHTQEERIKLNVENLLETILGKKTFMVSVMLNLQGTHVVEEAYTQDPQIASQSHKELINDDIEELKDKVSTRRVSVKGMKERLVTNPTVLPGLVNEETVTQNMVKLPGFPTIVNQFQKGKGGFKNYTNPSARGSLKPILSKSQSYSRETTDETVFYNINKQQINTPKTRINQMTIHVVVDSDYFELMDIDEDRLKTIISNGIYLDESRGDELVLSFVPFVAKPLMFHQTYIKNRPIIKFITDTFKKVQGPLVAIILLVVLIGVTWICMKHFHKVKAAQKIKQDKKELEELLAKQKEEDQQAQLMDKKKSSIIELAKNKPEQFADLLLHWIDEPIDVEKKEEVPNE